MSTTYRFEGPPGANRVASFLTKGRAIDTAKLRLRHHWRGSGDLLKVLRQDQDGEVFVGHVH